jgi:hypothetical protein
MDTVDLGRAEMLKENQPVGAEIHECPPVNKPPPMAEEILIMPWKPPTIVPRLSRDYRDWGINE